MRHLVTRSPCHLVIPPRPLRLSASPGARPRKVSFSMANFTWGRIAGLAGVTLATAGVVYLIRTERGRQLLAQGQEKARELLNRARQSAEETTAALPETTPDTTILSGPETAEAPAG